MLFRSFYIANAAATANVLNVSGGQPVVLPAGAIVTSVAITSTGANTIDMGFTPLVGVGPGQTTTLGTNVPNGYLNSANVSTRATVSVGSTGQGTQLGNVANATRLVVVTAAQGSPGANAGAVTGIIQYYVADATYGQQNV